LQILLILNNGAEHDFKVVVCLKTQYLINEVKTLVRRGYKKAAFDLIVSTAEVVTYVPAGRKSKTIPELTLVEDFL